jgi:hypothetical protein
MQKCVEKEAKEQGGQLVALLATPGEEYGGRPSIGKVCDIVCSFVQRLQEVNVWDVELPKPPPQPLMIRAIEGGFEVQIEHIEEGSALGPVFDRPV